MSIGAQIAENVLLHRQVSRAEALDRAVEVLSLVGLPQPKERIREFPHQFSGGMRQRAMIAIALACDPKLLIADEPTTALDVTIQKQILALIDGLRERLGMAVILVTHDLGVIAGHADRVAVMYAGKIAETASTDQVFAHARHPYTVALFDALPERVTQAGERLRTIPGMPPDLSAPLAGCAFAPRCANAQDTCRASDPPLSADSAHAFACFFPVDVLLQSAPADSDTGPDPDAKADLHAETSPTAEAVPVTETSPDGETSPDTGAGPDAGARLDGETSADAPASAATPATQQGLAGPPGDPAPAPTGDEAAPLLELAGLTKDFPVLKGLLRRQAGRISAVADVNLSVTPGSTLGIVGESGCGKTTVGRLIVGLEKPTSGTIKFAGADIADLAGEQAADYRRGIQYMFQDSAAAMDPRMRVGSIIREPMRLQHQGSGADQRRRVATLLDEVGLPGHRGGPLPARVLRGPAAAHLPGPGPRPHPPGHHRRRAGVGPGRVGPGPGAQRAARPAVRARADPDRDLPRPGRDPLPGRLHRGDVPGQAGRARTGPAGVRAAAASVHQRADRRRPGARPADRADPADGRRDRRTGQRDEPAVRLPVPHPLPAGLRRLRGAGTTAARARSGRPSGRLPPPAERFRRRPRGCPGSSGAGP